MGRNGGASYVHQADPRVSLYPAPTDPTSISSTARPFVGLCVISEFDRISAKQTIGQETIHNGQRHETHPPFSILGCDRDRSPVDSRRLMGANQNPQCHPADHLLPPSAGWSGGFLETMESCQRFRVAIREREEGSRRNPMGSLETILFQPHPGTIRFRQTE